MKLLSSEQSKNTKSFISRKRGAATNSILLSFVQCLTLVTSILQTRVLSGVLTKTEYGTYSQGMLVVNFLVPFLLLGLANAITFFSGQKGIDSKEYINTIVTIVFVLGIVGAIGIILLNNLIQAYFGNEALKSIIPLIAFIPLLLNLISVFQTLFVAENMASTIAVRNAIVAIVQVSIVAVSVFFFNDIRIIYVLLLIMDLVQVVIFANIFRLKRYVVKLCSIKKKIAGEIFAYSIPLAFSTAIGTLSIYMDKLLIGRMMGVEDFALYTNMAKELPFSFIVSSFTAVIMPAFVRLHANEDDDKLRMYWWKYLELGICITWVLCGAAIFCADDLLVFLYTDKYSRGIPIFVVYLIVELCRYSYFGIILSTFGKTKIIMYSSLFSLICNFILNILFYYKLGIIGPAIASLVSIFLMEVLQIVASCRLLKCKITDVFDFKYITLLAIEIIIVGGIVRYIGTFLNIHTTLKLILCGSLIVSVLGLLNYKRVIGLVKDINSL